MKKRYIAISQRLYSMKEYNEIRESLAIDWGQFFAIHLHDFLMLPLSYKQDIAPYLPDIAGVILSGGNDLSVCNETPLNKERDIFETNLIDLCIKDSIPLLGVCRGAQMIAYYFNSQITPCKNHVGLHEVVQDLETTQRFITNSFHNYAITQLGKDLRSLAISSDTKDYSIESFKHKSHNIFGIMWHIERDRGMENSEVFQKWKNALYTNSNNKDTK